MAAAGPADDGEENRRDPCPNRGIPRPEQIDPADRPFPQFAAAQRDRGARRAAAENHLFIRHRASGNMDNAA